MKRRLKILALCYAANLLGLAVWFVWASHRVNRLSDLIEEAYRQ